MSRRRNVDRQTEAICTWRGCDQPTPDDAFVCPACLDELGTCLRDLLPGVRGFSRASDGFASIHVLAPHEIDDRARDELPGLWDEVLATVAGEKGIDYAALGGGAPSDQTGIVLQERASQIGREVVRSLRALVVVCRDARVAHVAPAEQRLKGAGLVPDMVEWLLWRVDGIAWHAEATDRAQDVRDAVNEARWVVDRPATRQQLGPCPVKDCDGWLSATPGATFAHCNRDDHAIEAQPFRDQKIAELDDRLCTAAEIARLSTYLGLRQDREAVRKRVNQWAARDRITARPPVQGSLDPRFRFGDVHPLLLAAEPTPSSTDSKGA